MLGNEEGATSIEYALIASLVAVVLVAALTNLGTITSSFYAVVAALVSAAV